MVMSSDYQTTAPSREEIDSSQGAILLEFGTAWCGHCQAAAPLISEAISEFAAVRHIKVEDGPGRRLGRSFGIKLWPTAIFLKDGVELARVVRPDNTDQVRSGLRRIAHDS
jgi:thioredoxin 1